MGQSRSVMRMRTDVLLLLRLRGRMPRNSQTSNSTELKGTGHTLPEGMLRLINTINQELISTAILKLWNESGKPILMIGLIRYLFGIKVLEGKFRKAYDDTYRYLKRLARHGYIKWETEPLTGRPLTSFSVAELGAKKLQQELNCLEDKRKKVKSQLSFRPQMHHQFF